MKITGLRVTDFLILKDVELKPNSKLNIILGKNRHGKTSFIKAIQTGLKGTTDSSVIRKGANKSEIMIDLNGLKVHRTITPKGTRLKVTTAEGDYKASPQSYLDGLLSDFSFDPLAFMLLDGREKTKYLRDLFSVRISPEILKGVVEDSVIGLFNFEQDGFTILKNAEQMYYEKRTLINRQANQKKALYEDAASKIKDKTILPHDKLTEEKAILEAFNIEHEKKLTEALAVKRQAEGTVKLVERLEARIKETEKAISEIDNNNEIASIPFYESVISEIKIQIQEFEKQLDFAHHNLQKAKDMQAEKALMESQLNSDRSTLEALPSVKDIPDIEAIERDVALAKKELENHRMKEEDRVIQDEVDGILIEYNTLQGESKSLTEVIKKLGVDLPRELTAKANIPIQGLRFEGDKTLIGETSLDNLSTSEQIALAVSIVEAFNKDKPLKVLCLDRAESLDDDTLKEFVKQIPDDYQFFVSIVKHEGQDIPKGAFLVEHGAFVK